MYGPSRLWLTIGVTACAAAAFRRCNTIDTQTAKRPEAAVPHCKQLELLDPTMTQHDGRGGRPPRDGGSGPSHNPWGRAAPRTPAPRSAAPRAPA
ncbi:RNA methyltransferase, partial [Xanthomonas perforans]|nr:RNA methyltransferase [Xanthomonas perforans]